MSGEQIILLSDIHCPVEFWTKQDGPMSVCFKVDSHIEMFMGGSMQVLDARFGNAYGLLAQHLLQECSRCAIGIRCLNHTQFQIGKVRSSLDHFQLFLNKSAEETCNFIPIKEQKVLLGRVVKEDNSVGISVKRGAIAFGGQSSSGFVPSRRTNTLLDMFGATLVIQWPHTWSVGGLNVANAGFNRIDPI